MRKIRLAIVDDSVFIRKALQRLLEDEPSIEIVGAAATGEELIENLDKWQPDVITLDLSMPGMGGLNTLDHIMKWKKIPVIILSTHSSKDAPLTIEALHKGAVDFIDKQQYSLVDFDALRSILSEKIKNVAGKILSEMENNNRKFLIKEEKVSQPLPEVIEKVIPYKFEIILIGASTGGPPAIQYILESVGKYLTIPVVIVQHMPIGFTKAFANRLNQHLPFNVKEASNKELLKKNTVYIAPAGYHLLFEKQNNHSIQLILSEEPEECLHKPSIDILFESASEIFDNNIIAIILTGMGKDGTKGMLNLAQKGAYTIAQDESSCIVYGMPKSAIYSGAIKEILSLEQIPQRIKELLNLQG